MQARAETVIVGAGIVGATAAYHLAELGVTDVLVLDQGPLFETGGSTSHAPGLVFQTNGSRTMCRLAQDTVALYAARSRRRARLVRRRRDRGRDTPEPVQELKRRMGFARSYGIEGTELLTPAEAAERIPFLDPVDDPRRPTWFRATGSRRRFGRRRRSPGRPRRRASRSRAGSR